MQSNNLKSHMKKYPNTLLKKESSCRDAFEKGGVLAERGESWSIRMLETTALEVGPPRDCIEQDIIVYGVNSKISVDYDDVLREALKNEMEYIS